MSSISKNNKPETPYIILINFNDKAARVPHVCAFEEKEMRKDPNHPFSRSAITGGSEAFYYTDLLGHDYNEVEAGTIMRAFNNAGFTKGRFEYIVRPTDKIILNNNGLFNLSDYSYPSDVKRHDQVELNYNNTLKSMGAKVVSGRLFCS